MFFSILLSIIYKFRHKSTKKNANTQIYAHFFCIFHKKSVILHQNLYLLCENLSF